MAETCSPHPCLAVGGAAARVLFEYPVERDEELPGEVQGPHRVRHRRVECHQDERSENDKLYFSAQFCQISSIDVHMFTHFFGVFALLILAGFLKM